MGCTREKIVEAVIKRFPSTLSTESLNRVKAIAMDLASKAVVETPMVHQPSKVLTRLGGASIKTTTKIEKAATKENNSIIQPKESTANKLVEAAKGCAK